MNDTIGFHLRVSRVWMNQRMSNPLLYPQPIGSIGTGRNFAGDSHRFIRKWYVDAVCKLRQTFPRVSPKTSGMSRVKILIYVYDVYVQTYVTYVILCLRKESITTY